jgi:hypothetical protein
MAERKYDPLERYLAGAPGATLTLSFAELETIVGAPLPAGARSLWSWWANTPRSSQGRAWLGAGWRRREVNFGLRTVTFGRVSGDGAAVHQV